MLPSTSPNRITGLEKPKWFHLAATVVWSGSMVYVTGAANAAVADSDRAAASARRRMLRLFMVVSPVGSRGDPGLGSLDAAGFVERQARRTVEDAGRIALAQVDEEIGTDRSAGEEGLVHERGVEAGHRSGVQAQRAGGDQEVGA